MKRTSVLNRLMSTAFQSVKVRVTEVFGLEKKGVTLHSLWQKENLLFRSREDGTSTLPGLSRWARAVDKQNRTYLLWEAEHYRFQGLVIQPMDSHYCYEIFSDEDKVSGNTI
ncbi:MAG: hypothetical protein AB1585_02315 [Thermodesulfobacteriota bacterium]